MSSNEHSNSLTPANTTSQNTTPNSIANQRAGKVSIARGLHARLVRPAENNPAVDPLTKENRIALLLDASGSMGGSKNQSLRDAVSQFIQNCDFNNTSLAIDSFGASPEIRIALTCQAPLLMMTAMSIPAEGGTPMRTAMEHALLSYSMTRAVLVSDGQPDSESAAYDVATQYRDSGTPVDCVHIGSSSQGEACLQHIAELTGGKFIKFTDIASFTKNFKMLTPRYYATLTDGSVSAAQLGAREIK